MEFGILTLLPIVVLFILIFTTKRMLLSLTVASVVGSLMLGGPTGFASVWLGKVQAAFMAGTLGYLFLLLALFGILIVLLDSSGAVTEFATWLSKYANTRKKALLITYLLGWLIFVDDYLNNLAISTAMKKVADSHKIPRTFLGYVINSTAAPVCIIIPFSTWAVFYGGLFEEFGVTVNGTGTGAYLAAIPYLFFAWVTLIMMLLVIIGVVPMIGVTKKHNQIAQETGVVCPIDVNLDGVEIVAPDFASLVNQDGKAKPWNFLVPLVVLVAVTILAGTDVMIGCMAGIATIAIIMVAQRRVTMGKLFDNAYQGVTSMVMICAIITMALTLVEINTETGMSDFVVTTLSPYLSGALLPAIVFGFCAVYSYFGGGFWDMSMIFMPIVVPLAMALGVNPLLPCAALVCAAAAGSTTYVCGDAVMITSRAIDIKPYYQMLGTLPYAVISYVITVVCFVVAGFMAI
jgi:tetracycline resistance efflux pump